MGGFFGTISTQRCITDLFYGTDYNSHLGTKRGGLATFSTEKGFYRSIHNLENQYFRTRFEAELQKFPGESGIGVISDTDPQPIVINSHLGKMAVVTVAKINNLEELTRELLDEGDHFSEMSSGKTNPTELVTLLIARGHTFVEGIELVFEKIKGSCSMLILTENGIIAARDKLGRTPIVIGRKEGAWAATSETTAFPNLGFEVEHYVGPGEIVRLTANGMEQLRKPNEEMFLPLGLLRFPHQQLRRSQRRSHAPHLRSAHGTAGPNGGGQRQWHTGQRTGNGYGLRRGNRSTLPPCRLEVHAHVASFLHAWQPAHA